MKIAESLIEVKENGSTAMVITNTGNSACQLQKGMDLGQIFVCELVDIANQLEKMRVITPSKSPWSSPVMLVSKKDGTLRFCVDYRVLNSNTKPDLFLLPRIDDLLDQLGKARFFTTLDLASGYWQIKVHENSQQKTAFITHQGLYESRVMPFGIMNAPAVFQHLLQKVLSGIQCDNGKSSGKQTNF